MSYWQINKWKKKNRKDKKRKRILEIWGPSVFKESYILHQNTTSQKEKHDLIRLAYFLHEEMEELTKVCFTTDMDEEEYELYRFYYDDIYNKYMDAMRCFMNIINISKDLKRIDIDRYYISRGMNAVRHISYPLDYYYSIERVFTRIKTVLNLLKALSKRINFVLNLIKKIIRNLRVIFGNYHPFCFKNLDDYHATNLNLSF